MLKLERIIADRIYWVDGLYSKDEKIGFVGFDNEGLFVNSSRQLTPKEISVIMESLKEDYPLLKKDMVEITVCDQLLT